MVGREKPTKEGYLCIIQEYSVKERDIIKLGKQKMRVREVVPADYNQSVVIPNSHINLSKSIYNELHFQDKL
jgi:hypothetical protein